MHVERDVKSSCEAKYKSPYMAFVKCQTLLTGFPNWDVSRVWSETNLWQIQTMSQGVGDVASVGILAYLSSLHVSLPPLSCDQMSQNEGPSSLFCFVLFYPIHEQLCHSSPSMTTSMQSGTKPIRSLQCCPQNASRTPTHFVCLVGTSTLSVMMDDSIDSLSWRMVLYSTKKKQISTVTSSASCFLVCEWLF